MEFKFIAPKLNMNGAVKSESHRFLQTGLPDVQLIHHNRTVSFKLIFFKV